MEKRCSTRNCGVHPQRFPAKEKAGVAREANEVGESGERKRASCPATTEVRSQSKRKLAVCRRTMPKFTPFPVAGKPPAKSNWTSAEVRAPAMVGPKTSKPISDWRKLAPRVA